MTNKNDEIWQKIQAISDDTSLADIDNLFQQSLDFAKNCDNEKHIAFYQAGYLAYCYSVKDTYKSRAKDLFLQALLWQNGYVPAVLYLTYLEVDNGNFLQALQMLACVTDENLPQADLRWQIYFSEIKAVCLIRCQYWEMALHELAKFDNFLALDTYAGIDLINFFKVIDEIQPKNSLENLVIEKINRITEYPF